jgi:hypothetical protein
MLNLSGKPSGIGQFSLIPQGTDGKLSQAGKMGAVL